LTKALPPKREAFQICQKGKEHILLLKKRKRKRLLVVGAMPSQVLRRPRQAWGAATARSMNQRFGGEMNVFLTFRNLGISALLPPPPRVSGEAGGS
jgi:hypothetical protein